MKQLLNNLETIKVLKLATKMLTIQDISHSFNKDELSISVNVWNNELTERYNLELSKKEIKKLSDDYIKYYLDVLPF
tara:strand:+ start:50 stop:280 length:231 start_codon:yes stop_codon:yes gene_type:complete